MTKRHGTWAGADKITHKYKNLDEGMSAKVTAHKREGVRRTTVANSLPMLCVRPALECLVN